MLDAWEHRLCTVRFSDATDTLFTDVDEVDLWKW